MFEQRRARRSYCQYVNVNAEEKAQKKKIHATTIPRTAAEEGET